MSGGNSEARLQQAGIGLGIVGDGKGWAGAATRSDGQANRSDKISRQRPQVFLNLSVEGRQLGVITFELFADILVADADCFEDTTVQHPSRVFYRGVAKNGVGDIQGALVERPNPRQAHADLLHRSLDVTIG